MKTLMTSGRRPLLATAAALALGTAVLLPVDLAARDKVAAASTGHVHSQATDGIPGAPIDIARDPTDLPGPIEARGPRRIKVNLETVEVTGQLADGATYHYWTFNKKVPGPFVRVKVGDTVEVSLKNHDDSMLMHNVDFHAVTGPGGGAKATEAAPGESRGFEFKALNPGLYVYHCATPMVAQHIANGMYGLILVEPEGGLPKVDREFYVMQGEIYTEKPIGTPGAPGGELRQAHERASGILRVQRHHRQPEEGSPQGEGRRDRAHVFRRRRTELHLVVSRHRGDFRQGLSHGLADRASRSTTSRPSRLLRVAPSWWISSSTCRATISWSIMR